MIVDEAEQGVPDELDGIEIDYSDLEAKYFPRLDDSYDTALLIDNLPIIDRSKEEKLLAVLRKNVFSVAKANPIAESICMPRDPSNDMSKGYLFVEFPTVEEASAALQAVHGYRLDKAHVLSAVKLCDFERILTTERQFVEPEVEPFEEKGYLKSWLTDTMARDQFVTLVAGTVSVFWNNRGGASPELIKSKPNWTDLTVQWSVHGSYLVSLHGPGVMLWGGETFGLLGKFPHAGVKQTSWSNNEQFLVTWSPFDAKKPTEHNLLVWDVLTGRLVRGFVSEEPNLSWPQLKFSHTNQYAARIHEGSLSIYELPAFSLLDKKPIKIDGLKDFCWSPVDDMLVHWTMGSEDVPARVSLMQVPSRNIIRTKNLFNVTACQVHWQSRGDYLCVQVERHSKNKKHIFSNLELFRLRQKDIPVDCLEFKDCVAGFAWEPESDRFLVASTAELKTTISFYTMKGQDAQLPTSNTVKLLQSIERKVFNRFLWSPRGELLLLMSTDGSSSTLEFFNTSDMSTMSSREHFLGTDAAWDPTGRYVASWVSSWKQSTDHGFVIWDARGEQQTRINMSKLALFAWRPRSTSLLSRDQSREIRRNIKNYAAAFEEADLRELSKESSNSKEMKSRLVSLWNEWRRHCRREAESRNARRRELLSSTASPSTESGKTVIVEEWIEEVLEETVEILS